MIVNQHGKISVTSDCASIVNQLDIMHPAAKMAVLASQMQDQEVISLFFLLRIIPANKSRPPLTLFSYFFSFSQRLEMEPTLF